MTHAGQNGLHVCQVLTHQHSPDRRTRASTHPLESRPRESPQRQNRGCTKDDQQNRVHPSSSSQITVSAESAVSSATETTLVATFGEVSSKPKITCQSFTTNDSAALVGVCVHICTMTFFKSVDQVIVACAVGGIAVAAAAVAGALLCCPRRNAAAPRPRWFSDNPAKRWAEAIFILSSPLWVALMAYIVATGWYETFTGAHYMGVGVALAAPGLIIPLFSQPPEELRRPWWNRYWVKAHLWVWIVVFVGSYFWTHYFYTLLRATYTFEAWRLNDVPFAMYLAAHGYFMLYHSMTNMALRRWYTSSTYARLPRPFGTVGTAVLVIIMSWVTAFMEAFTIQGFPYYHIEDRAFMYTVGAIVYGLYFVVSFPMHYEIDGGEPEDCAPQLSAASAPAPAPESAAAAPSEETPRSADADPAGPSSERSASREEPPRSGGSVRKRRGSVSSAAGKASAAAPAASSGNAATKSSKASDAAPVADFHAGTTGSPAAANWSPWNTAVHACGASMIVTLLLDFWRLAYTALADKERVVAAGLPWTSGAGAA